jgi:purine-nucleoside/S-methyl-5'-thioadenosine phosphorylase / adenosine deaminase
MRPQPSGGFVWVQASGGPALACRALQPNTRHLYTTRAWALGSRGPDDEAAWEAVAAAVDVDRSRLLRLRQVHGATVVVHRAGEPAPVTRPAADILVTDDPVVALAIQTADCVPLLFADARTGAVAAAHAGWRGLAARVPSIAVNALARAFGSLPGDLVAAVGPSISAENYEVGRDVRDRFVAAGFSASEIERWFRSAGRPDHWFFDGWQSAREQLESSGLVRDHICVSGLCTAAYPDLFCSYRRDGSGAGRIAAVIRSAL